MKFTFVLLTATLLAGASDRHSAIQLNNQATQLYAQGRYAGAETLYRQALAEFEQIAPDAGRDRAIALQNLGSLLAARGRYPEAAALLTDALRRFETASGPASADAGRALYNLAAVYRALGDLRHAEQAAERGSRLGSDSDRARARMVLACIYADQRRSAEAEAILKPALAEARGDLVVAIGANLAEVALQQGRLRDAEAFARQALEAAQAIEPACRPARAAALNAMGQALQAQGHYAAAENYLRQSVEAWEELRGPAHPDFAQQLLNLAAFLHQRGRERAAEDLYNRAIDIFSRALGKEHLLVAAARSDLADVLRAERRYTEAAALSRATLPVLEKSLDPTDSRVLRAQAYRSRLLTDIAGGGKTVVGDNGRPAPHAPSAAGIF